MIQFWEFTNGILLGKIVDFEKNPVQFFIQKYFVDLSSVAKQSINGYVRQNLGLISEFHFILSKNYRFLKSCKKLSKF